MAAVWVPRTKKDSDDEDSSDPDEWRRWPYRCGHCPTEFMDQVTLNKHLQKMHAKERPHQCLVCKKTFYRLCNLKRHSVVHSVERPYACEVCKKTFKTKYYLKNHERTHTGERPYKCSWCDKAFTQSGSRNLHIKRKHPELRRCTSHCCVHTIC